MTASLGLVGLTLLYGFASALVPVLPIEVWVGGIATQTGSGVVLGSCVVAATLGQMAGKLLVFHLGRGVVDLPWLKKRTKTSGRWSARLARAEAWARRRPWGPATLCLVSAFSGLPPFAAVAFLLGTMRVDWRLFLLAGLVGRGARFALVALAPAAAASLW